MTSKKKKKKKKKKTRKAHQYFITFESQIDVDLSASSRCNSFHVDLPFTIYEISKDYLTRTFEVESMANQRKCIHW